MSRTEPSGEGPWSMEALLELVHGMPPDLAEAQLVLHGVEAPRRALVQAVLGALDAPDDDAADDGLEAGDSRYQIVRCLSDEGATAEVWLAHDRVLARDVAVKWFRDARSAVSERQPLGPVIAEARAVARVASDHVVAVYDVVRLRGRVAIVMEKLDGASLAASPPTRVEDIVKLLVDVATGVADAHARGVFHLDLKPANVLTVDGQRARAKVGDFGLARLTTDRSGRGDDTFVGVRGAGDARRVVAGTIAWMSPEAAAGLPMPLDAVRHAKLLAAADVYGLGALAYGLLTGRAPHEASAGEDRLARLARIARGEAPPDGVVAGRLVPRGLARVMRRAMAFDREQRPTSARAFADALIAWRASVARRRRVTFGVVAVALLAFVAVLAWPRADARDAEDVASGTVRETSDATAGLRIDPEADDGFVAPLTPDDEASALVRANAPTIDAGGGPTREASADMDKSLDERGDARATSDGKAPALSVRLPPREHAAQEPVAVAVSPLVAFAGTRPGELVVDPRDGTPEQVLRDVLAAAREPDEAVGWRALQALLHSEARDSHARDLSFAALRRLVWTYAPDPSRVAYWLDSKRPDPKRPERLRLFVASTRDVMPRPFAFVRDPAADDAWRLVSY